MLSPRLSLQDVVRTPALRDLPQRICVRPPYFALAGIALEGRYLEANAVAEAPAPLEVGPMPAAEIGRHAAITGLCHAAASQDDDRRRYYLAQHAECAYHASDLPYGTQVRFRSELLELTKRSARAEVIATSEGERIGALTVDYTILTEAAFERLFRSRARTTSASASPYGELLQREYRRAGDVVEQVIDAIPARACVGHFDGYPALPVAVLMGQLAYLAGELHGDGERRFRVTRGSVDASDLAWAGERARFRVAHVGAEGDAERYRCDAFAGERQVGSMMLSLVSAAAVS